MLTELPPPDPQTAGAARAYGVQAGLAPFPAQLGAWLAAWQGRFPVRLDHPRLALFAADHSGLPPSATGQEVEAHVNGKAPLNALAEEMDTDLRLYEMNLAEPAADFTIGAAMSEDECVHAILYGMMAVQAGLDLLALGSLGNGERLAAGVLGRCLGHESVAQELLTPENQARCTAAMELHGRTEPMELLRRIGGRAMAAIFGAILAARMAHTPVLLEGPTALLAAALLHRLEPRAVQHTLYVGTPSCPAALQLADSMGMMHAAAEEADSLGMASANFIRLLRAATQEARAA